MRFVVKRCTTKHIDVCSFEVFENKKEGILGKWKTLALTAAVSSVITGITLLYFFPEELKFEMHREMSIKIEKAYEPKRNSASTNGTPTAIN